MPGPVRRSNLLKDRLTRFTRVLPGVEKGDVRSLHRARVASRRLRELVPVLQLDHSVARKLIRRLRKITRRLGPVRELDVLLLLVDELRTSHPSHRDALKRIEVSVGKSRDEAGRRLIERLPPEGIWRTSDKLGRVLDDLRQADQASASSKHSRAAIWAIDARVANRAAKVTAAIQEAGAVYLPERLHAVRITIKKLRYALELAAAMRPGGATGSRAADAATALRALKRIQEVLGRMHDLQGLIERVRHLQASAALPNLGSWHELDSFVVTLEDMCRRLHARYIRERTSIGAIASRLCATPRHTFAPRVERRAG